MSPAHLRRRSGEDKQSVDEYANEELYFEERNDHRVKKGGVDMNSTYM
jgi:hypothetical protein